jgi:hypothetical protein
LLDADALEPFEALVYEPKPALRESQKMHDKTHLDYICTDVNLKRNTLISF